MRCCSVSRHQCFLLCKCFCFLFDFPFPDILHFPSDSFPLTVLVRHPSRPLPCSLSLCFLPLLTLLRGLLSLAFFPPVILGSWMLDGLWQLRPDWSDRGECIPIAVKAGCIFRWCCCDMKRRQWGLTCWFLHISTYIHTLILQVRIVCLCGNWMSGLLFAL